MLDNLLGSMKYVLTGMGLLRINLDDPKNRVGETGAHPCTRLDMGEALSVSVRLYTEEYPEIPGHSSVT